MLSAIVAPLLPLAVSPPDTRFQYEGRWKLASSSAVADWPCSGVRFAVNAGADGATLRVTWAGLRVRLNASVVAPSGSSSTIFKGPPIGLPFEQPQHDELSLPPGSSLVRLRKLGSGTPYSEGIGREVFHASVFDFRGVDVVQGNATIEPAPSRKARRVEVIGASDSAGWCVDGSPNTSSFDYALFGWEYSDCDGAAGAELARRFDADVSVQALAGAGLTQNANAKQQWQMGKQTMADYYTRTLQTDSKTPWTMSEHTPPQACRRCRRPYMLCPGGARGARVCVCLQARAQRQPLGTTAAPPPPGHAWWCVRARSSCWCRSAVTTTTTRAATCPPTPPSPQRVRAHPATTRRDSPRTRRLLHDACPARWCRRARHEAALRHLQQLLRRAACCRECVRAGLAD